MNKGARVFTCYWGDVLVAMFSTLNLPNGRSKYSFRVHRVVVLPDYQGLKIGTKLIEFFGEYFLSRGEKMHLRSSHIRLANHCRKSNKWIESSSSEKAPSVLPDSQARKYRNTNMKRTPYSFEYVGEQYNEKEHQNIVCIGDCDISKAEKMLDKIIDKNKYPIVITGVADQSQKTPFEIVAKERGIRTEVLFFKSKDVFSINKKAVKNDFDAILIGKEAQKEISQFKSAKEINNLITYNYKYDPPKYFEKFGNNIKNF